ncbi:MAG: sigma-70 family RNA polymerase sigma factor [Bacteroidota bacterium]
MWLSFDHYDQRSKLSTWVYRIALNSSISSYRKEKRRADINHPIPGGIIEVVEEEKEEDIRPILKRLLQFITELKELDRALILLYLEGYNQQEMANILGLSQTNVSTKVHRIKKKLRQKFTTQNK